MQNNYSIFNDYPAYLPIEAEDFNTPESVELYNEIMNIAQEIAVCRASL